MSLSQIRFIRLPMQPCCSVALSGGSVDCLQRNHVHQLKENDSGDPGREQDPQPQADFFLVLLSSIRTTYLGSRIFSRRMPQKSPIVIRRIFIVFSYLSVSSRSTEWCEDCLSYGLGTTAAAAANIDLRVIMCLPSVASCMFISHAGECLGR